jgi:polyhydroxybutyrate depolymerase
MRLLILLIFVLLHGTASAETRRLTHDGIEREFIIDGARPGTPAPAVLVIHGGGGKANRIRRYANFKLVEQGWVEIYPQGIDNLWNDGRRALAGGPLRTTDDIGFLRALLTGLIADQTIDPAHIYVTGPSNGGSMTHRMVCQASDLIAGAAPVIMSFPVGLDCPPGRAIPMTYVLGTGDPLVPFTGGPVTVGKRDRGAVMPAPDTLAYFARRNGCGIADQRVLPRKVADDPTEVSLITYRDCDAPLAAYVIDGGGHTWAGTRSRRLLERVLGPTSQQISATEVISRFFLGLAGR